MVGDTDIQQFVTQKLDGTIYENVNQGICVSLGTLLMSDYLRLLQIPLHIIAIYIHDIITSDTLLLICLTIKYT